MLTVVACGAIVAVVVALTFAAVRRIRPPSLLRIPVLLGGLYAAFFVSLMAGSPDTALLSWLFALLVLATLRGFNAIDERRGVKRPPGIR